MDPSVNYNEALKNRLAGTGKWFLDSDSYKSWKTAGSNIWLHGFPGCGKTILSSTIIEDVMRECENDPKKSVAYFFFSFNDTQKQSPDLMFRSIICQLIRHMEIPPRLDALYSSCQRSQRRPTAAELTEVIKTVVQHYSDTYIIIDALDECNQPTELIEVIEILELLQNTHLLLTSRKERYLEKALESLVEDHNTICLRCDKVDEDIQKYVRYQISCNKDLKKWREIPTMKDEIENTLKRGAHGMY